MKYQQEEQVEGKRLKTLSPKKLWAILPVLLAQTKARNSS